MSRSHLFIYLKFSLLHEENHELKNQQPFSWSFIYSIKSEMKTLIKNLPNNFCLTNLYERNIFLQLFNVEI